MSCSSFVIIIWQPVQDRTILSFCIGQRVVVLLPVSVGTPVVLSKMFVSVEDIRGGGRWKVQWNV